MSFLYVCDVCRKEITEREYVSAGFILSNLTFHPACVPSITRFLKKIEKAKREKSKE